MIGAGNLLGLSLHGVDASLSLDCNELQVEGGSGLEPGCDDHTEDGGEVGGGGGEGAEADNHELLDEGTSGLTERVADDINGGLSL